MDCVYCGKHVLKERSVIYDFCEDCKFVKVRVGNPRVICTEEKGRFDIYYIGPEDAVGGSRGFAGAGFVFEYTDGILLYSSNVFFNTTLDPEDPAQKRRIEAFGVKATARILKYHEKQTIDGERKIVVLNNKDLVQKRFADLKKEKGAFYV